MNQEYIKILAQESRRARLQRWKNLANEVFAGIMFVCVVLFFAFLTQG